MDEDVKLDEDATQKIEEPEFREETTASAKRPRVRMKMRKKVPAVARLTTTPSSMTPVDETTIPSVELPMEHRFGQGIDLEMVDVIADDIDLGVKNAELTRQRFRSRNRLKDQKKEEVDDVIKIKWRHGSRPLPSESSGDNGRKGIRYREEYPVIVCDDPSDCPNPIFDNPPATYEFGSRRKANKIIPPAYNVKQTSRGNRPVSGDGRRRFKPFKRTRGSLGVLGRNKTAPSGGGETSQLVVPQRMRVKDFAREEKTRKEAAAALKLKTRKKTMRRKMRPVAQTARVTMTSTVATTTEENGVGGGVGMRNRPMRPFRRRRPTTSSPFVVMDGGAGEGEGEDLQVAQETTTQHVPLDMVLMRDMSLPELEQFMANKVKEMNKKIKRVMKGHMEPKGDSVSSPRPRLKVATPAPTALASTTSYPAVPELDLRRTTPRGKSPNGGRLGNSDSSDVLFRDQLRIRLVG